MIVDIDGEKITGIEHLKMLDDLGFVPGDECFKSFRFGSA